VIQFNKDRRIFDEDDVDIWELEHLSLSYKNIIKIDNLGGIIKLTKLQLDNNIICKIQNLDELVNLQWLDLSFNQIEVIEGLDKLSKLADLSLYNNNIKMLSGLENLPNLNVLSVGKNLIEDHEIAIKYLQNLSNKLEVLKMADNKFPAHSHEDYKQYAIAQIRALKYLDYDLIDEESRERAYEKYKDQHNDKKLNDAEKVNVDVEIDHELVAARCEQTVNIFKNVIDDDEEMKKLR
jgi:hypothetical protein